MSDLERTSAWRVVEAAAVILVLGFFLYATRSILNPVFLFALLWAVLLPFRGGRRTAALLGVAGVVTLVWLLSTTGSLLAPFVLAVVLAYILDPLVDLVERLKVSRLLAMALLSILAVGLGATALVVVLPAAIRQLGVVQDIPVFLERLESIDAAAVVDFVQERREALGS